MSYDTAITELRQVLADTDKHKRSTQKKLLGKVDGDNKQFVTYDKRIVEDTFQAYVDGQSVGFIIDDVVGGLLTLSDPPDAQSKVTASYYWQWWLDEELKTFLNKGAESTSQWTTEIPDDAYLSIQPGLKSAALQYAQYWALQSLINYISMRKHSAEYVIEEDGNDDANTASMVDAIRRQADSLWKSANIARDDFYKRLGQRNAPAFGVKVGSGRQYGPMR